MINIDFSERDKEPVYDVCNTYLNVLSVIIALQQFSTLYGEMIRYSL